MNGRGNFCVRKARKNIINVDIIDNCTNNCRTMELLLGKREMAVRGPHSSAAGQDGETGEQEPPSVLTQSGTQSQSPK